MKRFLSILLAAATLAVLPVKAETNSLKAHARLWRAIQDVGVTTLLNSPRYCNGDVLGVYDSSRAILAVCQTGAKGYKEVAWSDEDFDTLRHEAHHLIQDCVVGRIGDIEMGHMFTDGDQFRAFVNNALTTSEIKSIISVYRDVGASDNVVMIELEAFAVADSISADTIALKVHDWCGGTK
jgi:hypothetical protein